MIITITGDLGSGKSTAGKLLAEQLGYTYLSTGQIQRELAGKLGITIHELNKQAETDSSIDKQLDEYIKGLQHNSANMVIDSRLAWHFLPNSYSVYLVVDPATAATRIYNDATRGDSESNYLSVNDVLQKNSERKRSEHKRFLELYDVDCGDMCNYDVVIDTTGVAAGDVVARILTKMVDRYGFVNDGEFTSDEIMNFLSEEGDSDDENCK